MRLWRPEHRAGVFRYLCRIVGQRETAHDLTQEAFARLLSRWVSVREPRHYVYRIATNLARREWERAARLGDSPIETATQDQIQSLAVRMAVGRLPRRLKAVVVLYYFADFPVDEKLRIGAGGILSKRQIGAIVHAVDRLESFTSVRDFVRVAAGGAQSSRTRGR